MAGPPCLPANAECPVVDLLPFNLGIPEREINLRSGKLSSDVYMGLTKYGFLCIENHGIKEEEVRGYITCGMHPVMAGLPSPPTLTALAGGDPHFNHKLSRQYFHFDHLIPLKRANLPQCLDRTWKPCQNGRLTI